MADIAERIRDDADNLPVDRIEDCGNDDRRDHAEPWGTPDLSVLSQHTVPAPALPLRIFGAWANWIEAQADIVSAPVDYVAWSLIAAVGSTVANLRWSSPWDGWKEPPVINIGLVGLPSAGKSPAIDLIANPLREAERRLGRGFDDEFRDWRLIDEVARAKAGDWKKAVKAAVNEGSCPPEMPADAITPPEPKRPRIIMSDATMEAAAQLISAHPFGLLMLRDELAGWIGGLDKYGGGAGAEHAFWLEAWGGRSKVVDRVKFEGKELVVPHLSIGVLGGIQPDRLATLILSGDDDGLAARFILLWPEPAPLTRPTKRADPEKLVDAFVRLRSFKPGQSADGSTYPLAVPFSDDAADLLHEFRGQLRALESSSSGLFLSHIGKWPGMAVRIALILELLWWAAADDPVGGGPVEISANSAAGAITLLAEYVQPMARRIYGEATLPKVERDATALARHLMSKIRKEGVLERISSREIQRARIEGLRTADEVKAALGELEAAGWVRAASSSVELTVGRPKVEWMVNPALGTMT